MKNEEKMVSIAIFFCHVIIMFDTLDWFKDDYLMAVIHNSSNVFLSKVLSLFKVVKHNKM